MVREVGVPPLLYTTSQGAVSDKVIVRLVVVVVPWQNAPDPLIDAIGEAKTDTGKQADWLPQLLAAVTQICPETGLGKSALTLAPLPVNVTPPGADHV